MNESDLKRTFFEERISFIVNGKRNQYLMGMGVERDIHYFWKSSIKTIQNGANLANLSGMCHQGNVSET